jgi:hypothetical protein
MKLWPRRKASSSPAPAASIHEPPRPPLVLSYAVLAGLALAGAGLVVVEHEVSNEIGKSLLQHAASAFIVAAVIGLSYERLLHKHRIAENHRLLAEHGEKTLRAVGAMWNLLPADMFALLREIVSHNYEESRKIPTLYSPARVAGEYTFASSVSYFDAIVDVARRDVVKVLTQWTQPGSNAGLRFLASDFVGRYKLIELQEHLFSSYAAVAAQWNDLDANEKGLALNYLWAASRCERKMYARLAATVKTTSDAFVLQWILFVPHQMQDSALCTVVSEYLSRSDVHTTDTIRPAIQALAKLYGAERRRVNRVLSKHAKKLTHPEIHSEIRTAWAALHLSCDDVLRRVGAAH